jgi:hypothetical protein
MDDETLNLCLSLAMEWGDDWLKPIQSRLKAIRPDLSPAQRRECNSIAQSAMKIGRKLVLDYLKPDFESDFDGWSEALLDEFPWVSSDNLSRCFSQGAYYARK